MRNEEIEISGKPDAPVMPLVSIIVPIYNIERYLSACIESILEQSYRNIEIILVDDGSTDASGSICDDYAKLDTRIIVIHKKNGGPSAARNAGIDSCHGEWLSFVDGDDVVATSFIERMYKSVIETSSDMAYMAYHQTIADTSSETAFSNGDQEECSLVEVDPRRALELMLYQTISNGAQFQLCKRELFRELRFPEGLRFEDVITVPLEIMLSNKVVLVYSPIYGYRIRKGSFMHSAFNETKLDVITASRALVKNIAAYDNSLAAAASSRAFAMNFSIFISVPLRDRNTMKQLWSEILCYRKTVIHDHSHIMRRKNKFAAWCACLGMTPAYLVGKIYQRASAIGRRFGKNAE